MNRQGQRTQAEQLATHWFNDTVPQLSSVGVALEAVDRYSAQFSRLLKLSRHNNRKSSYLDVLSALTKRWTDELIHPLQVGPPQRQSLLSGLLADLHDPNETEYLQEAIQAANANLYRAAAVLGWCAAIDRVHRRIEDLGFSAFNVASAKMASETKGRYKKFSKTQNVHSLAEVREVFDSVILWVIEGMGLVDTNEHARLRGCFELRSQSAHPGNASVTEYNLLSFFSDINEIIFKNPKFAVSASERDTSG